MTDVTAVILTKNEEKNLRKCIESFCGIAKRFVIVDSGSTDVQIQLGDSQTLYLQGMLLCKREASMTHDENFVLAYAVIGQPINIRNFINVPFQGMIGGVGYCATQQ